MRHCTFCNMQGHTLKFCYNAPKDDQNEQTHERETAQKEPQTAAIEVDFSNYLTFSENY